MPNTVDSLVAHPDRLRKAEQHSRPKVKPANGHWNTVVQLSRRLSGSAGTPADVSRVNR